MNDALNILSIEDSPADFMLITRNLRQQDVAANLFRVETYPALQQALDRGGWDIVLSDYNLPDMKFLQCMEMVHRSSPHIPVILVSGSVGEEMAVELLKQGVCDFVLKDNLTRLVPAIRRGLREAEEKLARRAAEEALKISEERFKLAVQGANDGVWDWDLRNDVFYFSPRWKSMLGYADDELDNAYSSWERLLHPDDREAVLAKLVAYLQKRSPKYEVEFRLRHKEGHYVDILSRGYLILSDQGEPLRLVGTHVDITERMRAFKAIRESEKSFRSLFDNMLEGFASCRMVWDDDGRAADFVYLNVNRAFGELTGLKDVIGKSVSQVVPGIRETNSELLEIYGRVAATGRPERFEAYVPSLQSWFSTSVYSTRQDEFIAVFDNVTTRKTAETRQHATIDLLRICNEADSSRDLMKRATRYLQEFTGCEAIGVRLHSGDDYPYYETRGFSAEFLLVENSLCSHNKRGEPERDDSGNPLLECMCGNIISGRFDPAKPFFTPHGSFWSSATTELLASTTEEDRQAKTRDRCNAAGYESVALVPLRTQSRVFGLFQFNDRRRGWFTAEKVALLENLTDYVAIALSNQMTHEALNESNSSRRLAEESLRKLHVAVEQSPIVIVITDARAKIEYANPRFTQMTGYTIEEAIGQNPRMLKGNTPDEVYRDLWATISSGQVWEGDFHNMKKDGTLFWEHAVIAPIRDEAGAISHYLAMKQDITKHRHLEEQLRQAQKMEAIGTLTGGIAHDFNNMLNVIIGYGTLAKNSLEPDHVANTHLNEVLAASERAASLTRQLLSFSRKQTPELKAVDVNGVIQELEKMLSRIIGEDIQLVISPVGRPLMVMADTGQIDQVLLNLAANARDAMPRGGSLTIRTEVTELDDSFEEAYGYGKPGTYALISVTDTGCGMDAELQSKIFEPFFTTKEVGKGTGMGLSISYGIVAQHKGFIKVYSEPSQGTTFRLYLPLAEESQDTRYQHWPVDGVTGGTETILIAEDDASLRPLFRIILESFGYTVLTAENGEEAVARFQEHCDHIQLVILDMIMPRMDGREAHARIKAICPEVKVILASGYSTERVTMEELSTVGMDCLNKPVAPKELLRKVREVLDR